jgi:hypothetical protein
MSQQLEDFYVWFPSGLLEYSQLRFWYQAEIMIWMHGLFIVLRGCFVGNPYRVVRLIEV